MKMPSLWKFALAGAIGSVLTSVAREVDFETLFRATPVAVQAENAPFVTVPTVGEVRDGWRFKGGDPSKEQSWERTVPLPKVGEVMDGYRYLGGDPGQERNWEQIQPRPSPAGH